MRLSIVLIAGLGASAVPGTTLACSPQGLAVYFKGSDATLSPEGERFVSGLIGWQIQPDGGSIRIVGHTDTLGSGAANHDLALRRAQTVARHLVAGGVPERLIKVEERGEEEGAVPTPDEHREPLNSRVEFDQEGREPSPTGVLGADCRPVPPQPDRPND